ncbi:MAG: xanthine dehydrogenase family protein subunit M [Deltaproteobacteria bacterium]|nr:xanthine dehydrogenase family protein subunit M [Deltaproteobacteria bacterium]
MRSRFQYIRPQSLQEALDFLGERGPDTTVLAGGTDLMIAIRRGDITNKYVLDVSRLEELRKVEIVDGRLFTGAALTYTEIMNDPTVLSFAPVLVQAASCVGSLQIRNVGTLGGNVANASPAGDAVTALTVHDAKVEIVGATASRREPLADVIIGPYRTTLKPGELITRFELQPLGQGYRFTFKRIARRRSLSIARINIAAVGQVHPNGLVKDLRLSVGSATPQPSRMTSAEETLCGMIPNWSLIKEAAKKVSTEMIRRSGVRPSTEYKKPAVEGLVIKALAELFIE